MSKSEPSTTHVLNQRRRYVRQLEEPRLPFAPYGLLPVLASAFLLWFALFPFARGVIQQSTERAATQALIEIGAPWARAKVSGQWVILEGKPPSQAAALRALNAVRQQKSQTIFGGLTPATRVRSAFSTVTGETGETVITNPGDIQNPDWQFRLSEGILHLNGELPDTAARETVVETARSKIDPPRIVAVEDKLGISNAPAAEGYLLTTLRGINTLAQCDRGLATFKAEIFSLNCEIPKGRADAVQSLASAPLPLGMVGTIDVLPNEAVTACETSMSDLLESAKIEFAVGSARINAASAALLDQIAEAAKDCPGRLRIEGHTDNTGSLGKNAQLSRQRANAVRSALVTRGLPIERLVAEGYGAERPLSPNATAEGRARNRRIEIRVIKAPR